MHAAVLLRAPAPVHASRATAPRRARSCAVAGPALPCADAALPRRAALQRAALLALLPLSAAAVPTARAADAPEAPAFVAGPSGMQYADTVVGNGAEPEKGRLVKVGYVGTLTANGAALCHNQSRAALTAHCCAAHAFRAAGKKFDAARLFAFGAGNGEARA